MAPVLEIAFYLLLAYAASMTLPLVFNSTSTGLDPSWSFRINPAVRFAVHSQKHARIGSRIAPAKLSGCTSNPMIRSSLLLLIFLASFLLGMLLLFLLDGRHAAGLPTNTSNADVGSARLQKPMHLHEGSFRQDSLSLQSGNYPTGSLESLPVLPFRCLVLSFAGPIGRQSEAPASPPVQLNFTHA